MRFRSRRVCLSGWGWKRGKLRERRGSTEGKRSWGTCLSARSAFDFSYQPASRQPPVGCERKLSPNFLERNRQVLGAAIRKEATNRQLARCRLTSTSASQRNQRLGASAEVLSNQAKVAWTGVDLPCCVRLFINSAVCELGFEADLAWASRARCWRFRSSSFSSYCLISNSIKSPTRFIPVRARVAVSSGIKIGLFMTVQLDDWVSRVGEESPADNFDWHSPGSCRGDLLRCRWRNHRAGG